jgi:hypothetical protein
MEKSMLTDLRHYLDSSTDDDFIIREHDESGESGFKWSDFSQKKIEGSYDSARGFDRVNGICTADALGTRAFLDYLDLEFVLSGHQDFVTLGLLKEGATDGALSIGNFSHYNEDRPLTAPLDPRTTSRDEESLFQNDQDGVHSLYTPIWDARRYQPFRGRDKIVHQVMMKANQILATVVSSAVESRQLKATTYQKLVKEGDDYQLSTVFLKNPEKKVTEAGKLSFEQDLPATLEVLDRSVETYNAYHFSYDERRYELIDWTDFAELRSRYRTVCRGRPRTSDIEFVSKLTVGEEERVFLIGDLHSSLSSWSLILRDMMKCGAIDSNWKMADHCRLIFLGDLVDRGPYGLEIVFLTYKLKIHNPDRVAIINGNHEDRPVYRKYGFESNAEPAEWGEEETLTDGELVIQFDQRISFCQEGKVCFRKDPDLAYEVKTEEIDGSGLKHFYLESHGERFYLSRLEKDRPVPHRADRLPDQIGDLFIDLHGMVHQILYDLPSAVFLRFGKHRRILLCHGGVYYDEPLGDMIPKPKPKLKRRVKVRRKKEDSGAILDALDALGQEGGHYYYKYLKYKSKYLALVKPDGQ